MKGYLKIERNQPIWFFDHDDPDEAFIVNRLRQVYFLADQTGEVLQYSDNYKDIGFDKPNEIKSVLASATPVWRVRKDSHGVPYLIRTGVVYDERHTRPYVVAIGRSLAPDRKILSDFTWIEYVGLIPASILTASVLGWVLAGRALRPVSALAETAQRISGSNLNVRIPDRGAGDELDFLIEAFNRMIARLEGSFQQMRQFSTDVSHELRTPITAIRGQLEVALFTARTTEQYREAMLNALQDIERLSQIVRALLLLSQAESGQLALQKTRLDLASVVREIVDQFQIPAEEARVRLSAYLPGTCTATLDKVQIERMLSNLLSNAVKFTPAGGEVHVTLQCLGDQAEVVVEDTGCGIPAKHLPYIFDRFYQVRNEAASGPERGLGLGLSFVAWIVKAHQGTISVESTPGRGSRFIVRLPVVAPVPASNETPDPAVASG